MPTSAVLTHRGAQVRDLNAFLHDAGIEVLGMASGAAAGTRQLVVGHGDGPGPTHAVAVGYTAAGGAAIEAMTHHLEELQRRLDPPWRGLVPAPVEMLRVADLPALAVTAVPGQRATPEEGTPSRAASDGAPVQAWLVQLWRATAEEPAAVELGREALDVIRMRSRRLSGIGDTVRAVGRARARLGEVTVRLTAGHGCLCPQHVIVRDGAVVGVHDWSASRLRTDPLRDLGSWVVRSTGRRLEQVLPARTPLGRRFRDVVVAGLAEWGIPSACWRDVLLLVQAELAVAALEQGDVAAMAVLNQVARALRREK